MISFIKKAINSVGFDLVKRPLYKGKSRFEIQGLNYTFIRPSANYSPWAGDKDFMEIFNYVRRKFTLVDIYRAYELWQMVEKVTELDSNAAILEVGVWRGGTGAVMAKNLKTMNATNHI
jgi:O-methyltransferase